MTEYKLVPFEPTEFSKGDTEPRGDCGMFVAGINHNPSSSPRDQWEHRIEVYGDTPEHAEELRDRVLRALAVPAVQGEPVTAPQPSEQSACPVCHGEGLRLNPLTEVPVLCANCNGGQQPECGCCGQTDRCDDDCEAVVIGGHRAAEQQPACASQSVKSDSQAALSAESERQAPDVTQLVEALEQIERWDGFPSTDKTWEGSGEPVSYGAAFGSNGERDFMREVARRALAAHRKGGE